MANEYRYFLESNFAGVNRLFFLVYTNEGDNAKRFKTGRYYLSKGIIKKYNIIINEKYFYDQAINSDVVKILLLDVYYIMIISKIIID